MGGGVEWLRQTEEKEGRGGKEASQSNTGKSADIALICDERKRRRSPPSRIE